MAEDNYSILIVDRPLLSPRRIFLGIRHWFFLVIVCEVDIPYGLWYFIVYTGRPHASFKAGKY